MTRVCILTSVHRPFDQRIFYKQACSLAKAGYEVTLVAPTDLNKQVRDGVTVVGVPPPKSRWGRPRVWWRLLRFALRLKPDVVHFHDPELLILAPFLRLATGRRLRVVYDVHEYFVDSIAHKVWIPPYLRRPVAWLARTIEHILGRAVDGLIFVVEEQMPLYADWRASPVVVHNYPDTAAFSNPTPVRPFSQERFRLIYIGSLYARRGILVMLEALTQVVDRAPQALLVLGGAFESEEFRTRVFDFITEHNLDQHVSFVGWIDQTKLKDYLAGADVAWLPGLPVKQYQRRAISTKLLECMLMGLPIVSSDHRHRRLFIDEARCGFSVTADDPKAHADAILWLRQHPDERRAMGNRGRQLLLEKYTWEMEAKKLQAFYEKILGQEERG